MISSINKTLIKHKEDTNIYYNIKRYQSKNYLSIVIMMPKVNTDIRKKLQSSHQFILIQKLVLKQLFQNLSILLVKAMDLFYPQFIINYGNQNKNITQIRKINKK